MFIEELDQEAFQNLPIELKEGRLPQNNTEIVISDHIIENAKVDFSVGQMITLEIGKRLIDGEMLAQSNPYDETEIFEAEFTKTYTIVGIAKRSNMESYSAPGYTVYSLLEDKSHANQLYVLLKQPSWAFHFAEDFHLEEEQVSTNAEVLRFEGTSSNEAVNTTLYILAGIIIAIIMFASISVIRNSFTISVTERLRQFGMLASVGATSKQIKKTVTFEGILLGIIAIPLGIVGGIVGIWITLSVINGIIQEFSGGMLLNLHVSWQAIAIAAVLAFVTISLSAILPARKAAKISPIDAIRSSNDIKMTAKKLKTPRFLLKLFGIQGEIALKNLKRSKKKYRTTIFSIFVSITIFIAFSSFIEYGFKVSGAYYTEVDYNYVVQSDDAGDYQQIITLEDIKEYAIVRQAGIQMPLDYISDNILYPEEKENYIFRVITLNQEAYKQYLASIGVQDTQGAILVDKNVQYEDGKMREYEATNLKKGDSINLNGVSIQIEKKTTKVPFGQEETFSNSALLVVPEEIFNQICSAYEIPVTAGTLYIDSGNTGNLSDKIKQIDEDLLENCFDLTENIRYQNAIVLVISIFLYGFIILISLIGVTNIFNTVTTNMALRSKEFAVLKSIGMTDKEFKKMIHFESLFYGLKSLLYGIPVGILLSYLIFLAIGNMYETAYQLPYVAIMISILFVFVIIFMTMAYSVSRIKKQNMMETIRKENI